MVHMVMTAPMVVPIIIIGIILGFRFRVLILLPAFVVVSTIIALTLAHSSNLWSILLAISLAMAALQVGYLIGAAISCCANGAQRRALSINREYFS